MTTPSPNIFGLQIGWGAIFGFVNLVLGGGVLGAWIKNRPKMREVNLTAEEKLRDDLMGRLDKVEAALQGEREGRAADRRDLEQKIERQRELYESKLEVERARHEAAEMLGRHKVRNLETCLSSFLWMAEKRPDNIPDVVAEIRRMRADQELSEAAEKGAIAGAKIIGAAPARAL